MERKQLKDFISLGVSCQYLKRARSIGDLPYRGDGYVRYNIVEFSRILRANNLKVSLNAARMLLAPITLKLDESYPEDSGDVMTRDELSSISEAIKQLEVVLDAESPEVSAFFPIEKRYNTDLLLDNIGALFGTDSFEKLSENSKADFAEAGKCMLFERNTAAAYHLMRGSEGAVKHLYKCAIKRNRRKNLTWGSMVDHMNERGLLSESLKGTLDNFRKGFRNPVAHPEKFYSSDEAQDLLGTTTQLVNLIVAHEKYDDC